MPRYPTLVPFKWNKVLSKPGRAPSSVELVHGGNCWCSGLRVCYVHALGGCVDWVLVDLKAPNTSWVQIPAQLNARGRQARLSLSSLSSPALLWGDVGETAAEMCSPVSLWGSSMYGMACQLPRALQATPACCSPEQSHTSDEFHNWQQPQNPLQPSVNIDFSLRGFHPMVNPSKRNFYLFLFPPLDDLFTK